MCKVNILLNLPFIKVIRVKANIGKFLGLEVYHSDDCGETRNYEFRRIRTAKIIFSVQAEKEAAICLAENDDNDSDNVYEIFIGCWGGGESGIRRGKSDDVVKVETTDILSADEFRTFWIKVNKGVIKVLTRTTLGLLEIFL